MKIDLDELAKAMEQSDVRQSYVDIRNGRVVMMADESTEPTDDAKVLDHVFDIEDDFENYVPLPNLYDGDEVETMRAFAEARPREDTKKRLLDALEGAGGAIRFRHQVKYLLLQKKWEEFLHAHFLDVARWWCEENELEYEER